MAQTSARKLDDHDPFPALEVPLVGGGTLRLPEDIRGNWTIVIAYRGHF